MRRLLMFLMILALFCQSPLNTLAANGKVTYKGQAGQFVFEPGSDYSPTDLFPNFKDVMPGDVISQKITLKNDAANNVKVKVYMRSLGAQETSKEFLSQMSLRVVQLENTELFEAKAHETGALTEWTCLGTLYSGGQIDLEVVLEVPVTMDNRFQKEAGYLDWEFMVEEFPIEGSDPKPSSPILRPLGSGGTKTGDNAKIVFWIGCLVVSGTGIVLIRKRNKKD